MANQDFNSMTREELRQYMLEHRDDQAAFEFYLDKFRNRDNPVYPAPESLEDVSYLQKIIKQQKPDK